MKKIYFLPLIGSVVFCSGLSNAQQELRSQKHIKEYSHSLDIERIKPTIDNSIEKANPIWQNDFSVSSEWDIANSTGDAQNWEISTSTSTALGYGTGAWEDPTDIVTNENGYALFDSDAVGADGGTQDATLTYSQSIDLSLYSNVVLDFNQRVRVWQSTINYIEISNDGTNWVQFDVNADKSLSVLYEESKQINITSVAGGQSTVYIRLRYVGSWDYAWMVDDLKIIEQPANDIQLLSGYIAGVNNLGTEYGRTMANHVDPSYYFGNRVYNFGFADQTGVEVTATDGNFSSNFTLGSVLAGDTVDSENTENLTLPIGVYPFTFTVSSTEETLPDNIGNNSYNRYFEITDMEYSIDGIGVYDENALASLGTNSFTDESDGCMFASWYFVKETDNFSGIKVMLTSGSAPGGRIVAHIVDTATWLADNPVPLYSSVNNPSDGYVVTQQDIDNGYAIVNFDQQITLDPDLYYAAAELYSDGGTYDFRILDDQTVVQPFWASAIYLPLDGTSYTNGEALGIRLMADDQVGLENHIFEGVDVYPNPTVSTITITNDQNNTFKINIKDETGRIVYERDSFNSDISIDLSSYSNGMYFINVFNESNRYIKKIVKN